MMKSAFPIVGIGASAGGLAFHKFFDHMPADCGMGFVVILHLPDPSVERCALRELTR